MKRKFKRPPKPSGNPMHRIADRVQFRVACARSRLKRRSQGKKPYSLLSPPTCLLVPALFLLTGCSFNPPPNTGAYKRGLTETKESKARPAPVAVPQSYRFYTNRADDRLVESHTIQPPPTPPGHGPVPVFVAAPAVSNMFTAKVLPKPLPALKTNDLGHIVLTRLTVTPNNGGPTFVATLEGEERATVQADANVALVIMPIHFTNYIIEASERMGGDTNWRVMSSGVVFNTNGSITFIDVHGGTKPQQFFRQRPGK